MPHTVRKRGNKYAVVNKRTGKTKATSKTKRGAQANARIRDQGHKRKRRKKR
jgi:hypothetical protein